MKTISIHQPNFIPYLGFFYKWMKCDTFVFLDDAQFIKEGNIHRNRIKTSQGPQWLTIPILQKGRLGQSILEAQVTDDKRWKKKLLRTVYSNYSKAKYIDKLFDEFKEIFEKDECNLSNINIPILYWVAKKLENSIEKY